MKTICTRTIFCFSNFLSIFLKNEKKNAFFFREMEWRLDKEGREYHHYEDFCKLYRAEILNLNRMLDTLMRNGMLPANFQLPTGSLSNVSF